MLARNGGRLHDLDGLLSALSSYRNGIRSVIAVAGPPGVGKSWSGDWLTIQLNRERPGRAALLSADAFHLDERLLGGAGNRNEFGGPNSYDIQGMMQVLRRIKSNAEPSITVPSYDPELGLSRASARLIPQSIEIVIVEGRYLLIEEMPWAPLLGFFDLTVLADAPDPILASRLRERMLAEGMSNARASKLTDETLPPLARFIRNKSAEPDILLRSFD